MVLCPSNHHHNHDTDTNILIFMIVIHTQLDYNIYSIRLKIVA